MEPKIKTKNKEEKLRQKQMFRKKAVQLRVCGDSVLREEKIYGGKDL